MSCRRRSPSLIAADHCPDPAAIRAQVRAAAAAEIAASPAPHTGRTYWLTGPELISNYDVAAALSRLPGRPARSFGQSAGD